MTLLDFVLRLAVALGLGVLVGIERQWRQRMAGLRTNALVATGAALFVMLTPLAHDTSSPTRIAAQVVSGVGFLAGALIFREGFSMRGLNTAATIWCTAAIGTLSGMGLELQAAVGALAVLAANVLLRPIAQRINREPVEGTEVSTEYEVRVVCKTDQEERLRSHLLNGLSAASLPLRAIASTDIPDSSNVEVRATIAAAGKIDSQLETIVGRLSLESAVSSVSWSIRKVDVEHAGDGAAAE